MYKTHHIRVCNNKPNRNHDISFFTVKMAKNFEKLLKRLCMFSSPYLVNLETRQQKEWITKDK